MDLKKKLNARRKPWILHLNVRPPKILKKIECSKVGFDFTFKFSIFFQNLQPARKKKSGLGEPSQASEPTATPTVTAPVNAAATASASAAAIAAATVSFWVLDLASGAELQNSIF